MGIFSSNSMRSVLEGASVKRTAEPKITLEYETFKVGDDFTWIAETHIADVNEAANHLLKEIGIMEYALTEETGCDVEYDEISEDEAAESYAAGVAEFEEACKKSCKEGCCKEGCKSEGCKCGKCESCKAKAKAVTEMKCEGYDDEKKEEEKKEEEPKADEEKKDDAPKPDASNASKFANSKFVAYVKTIKDKIVKFFKDLISKVKTAIAKHTEANKCQKLAEIVKDAVTNGSKYPSIPDGKLTNWSEKIIDPNKWESIVDFNAIDRLGGTAGNYTPVAKDGEKKEDEKKDESKTEALDIFVEESATNVTATVVKAFGLPEGTKAEATDVFKAYKDGGKQLAMKDIYTILNNGPRLMEKANKTLTSMEKRISKVLDGFENQLEVKGMDKVKDQLGAAQAMLSELYSSYVGCSAGLSKAICGVVAESRVAATIIASGDEKKKDDAKEEAPKADAEKKEEAPKEEPKKEEEPKEEEFDFLNAFNGIF